MSFTWNTVNLGVLVPGDAPVKLEYGDSHPKASAKEGYTTIIALHGSAFNSNIWNAWLPYLDPSVRLIALNRPGFGRSGPIHESRTKLPANTEAHGRYVVDILAFIKYAVEKLGLPARDTKTRTGGVVLLGWLKGSAFLLSFLSLIAPDSHCPPDSHQMPPAFVEPYFSTLRVYVKSYIFYEPTGIQVGIPNYDSAKNSRAMPSAATKDHVRALLGMVPAEKRPLLEAALASEAVMAHESLSWNGVDDAERMAIASAAMDGLPGDTGLGVIYCKGTGTADSDAQGSKWIIDRFGGRKNTAARVLPGGNHFLMATDPKAWDDAVISLIKELDIAMA